MTSRPTTPWSGARTTSTPAASVPLALPWITGEPASLFWRARALGPAGPSRWSPAEGDQHAPDGATETVPAGPGFVRWSTVEGATSYEVWSWNTPGGRKTVSTITNVADEREYYVRATPLRPRPLARSRRAAGIRRHEERPPRRVVRALEPRLQVQRAGKVDDGACPHRRGRVGRRLDLRPPEASHARPGAHGQRSSDDAREPLPRVRVHRSRLREPRLHRLSGLQPGVRAAFVRWPGAREGQASDGRRHSGQAHRTGARRDRPREDRPLGHRRPPQDVDRPLAHDGRYYAVAVPVVVAHATTKASDAPQTGTTQTVTTTTVTTVTTQSGAPQAGTPQTDGAPDAAGTSTVVYQDAELPQDACKTGQLPHLRQVRLDAGRSRAAATRPRRGSRLTDGCSAPRRRSRASSAPRS